jgi:hypothetical protein
MPMLVNTIPKIVLCLLVYAQVAAGAQVTDPCNLPRDLWQEVTLKYPGAHLVTLQDLASDDKKLFLKDHRNACPGLVRVDFYGDSEPTLAMILIVGSGATEKAELVVAHRVRQKWETTLLDTAESSIPVVWSQSPGEYEDVYGEKKIRATRPVIVFCGYNGWAVLYAWIGNKVDKVWLSD